MKFVRIEGYADQFLALPVSAETKRRMGDPWAPALVVRSDASGASLNRFFGYDLTPMPEG